MEKLLKTEELDMNEAYTTSDFYQLLSLSLQLPTEELAEALIDGEFYQDALAILHELGCKAEDILHTEQKYRQLPKEFHNNSHSCFAEMRKEYNRLFSHPKIPIIGIYETTFNSDEKQDNVLLFVSPIALSTQQCYQEAGIRLINNSREPADHLCIELEFMMYLYREKGMALQKCEEHTVLTIEKQLNKFEELHLGRWVYKFFQRLHEESTIMPYHLIADIAKLGLNRVLKNAEK